MNQLLFLECSPRGKESLGTQQVLTVLKALSNLKSGNNNILVTTRSLARNPLTPLSSQYAQAVTSSVPFDDPVFALSERLIGELVSCDGLLISTPIHNCTVPAALKLWIDYVLRKERSFTVAQGGKMGLLRDRPTLVLVRSGSPCTGDNAKQPDFLTPYLHYALSIIGIHSVQFVYLPGLPPTSTTAETLAQTRHALAAFFVPFLPTGDIL